MNEFIIANRHSQTGKVLQFCHLSFKSLLWKGIYTQRGVKTTYYKALGNKWQRSFESHLGLDPYYYGSCATHIEEGSFIEYQYSSYSSLLLSTREVDRTLLF